MTHCIHGGDFSAVINGQYHKDLCAACLAKLQDNSPSSGHASFNRQQDLIDHQADVQQPYVGGRPNEQFIQAYPKKAREIFSNDEIRNSGR
jgi:hypothetical protein